MRHSLARSGIARVGAAIIASLIIAGTQLLLFSPSVAVIKR